MMNFEACEGNCRDLASDNAPISICRCRKSYWRQAVF